MNRFGKIKTIIVTFVLAVFCLCGCTMMLHTTNTEDNIKTTSKINTHQAVDDFTNKTKELVIKSSSSLKLPGSLVTSGNWCSSVPAIDQYSLGLPAGCEIVSATSLVNSLGFDATVKKMLQYININNNPNVNSSGDFVNSYNGSIYSAGGTFPPAIANMVSTYLNEQGSAYAMTDTTGTDFDILAQRANAGVPVLIWTTMYMGSPQFTNLTYDGWTWYINEHCVVLTGYNEQLNVVSVMDPMSGAIIERDYDDFRNIFNACGQMSTSLIYK